MMQHVYDIVLVCAVLCYIKDNSNWLNKKIKQSIGDILDDIFDSVFKEATYGKEIALNFGKYLENTCERIHFSNAAGV